MTVADLVIVGGTALLAWPMLRAGWPEIAGGYGHRLKGGLDDHGDAISLDDHDGVNGRRTERDRGVRPAARLLLWVCNRFDYGAVGDDAWYATIRGLASRPAVTLVSSTPFEWKYAQLLRATPLPSPAVLRPIGLLAPTEPRSESPAAIPHASRRSIVFVLPKINEARLDLAASLAARGVGVWTPGIWPDGMQQWGGPRGVADFLAAVHVPYAPTTFALYEHAQHGLLTFVPSARLMLSLYETRGLFFQATSSDTVTTGHGAPALDAALLATTEWYAPDNAPCFVYFDSLDDLVARLANTDFGARKREMRAWAAEHTNTTLARWRMIDAALLGSE